TGPRRLATALSLCLALATFGIPSAAAAYSPATDPNSMFSTTAYTGAQAWWAAGLTGKGVDVALIDSGVSPVDGLNSPGKIVYGPDLSPSSPASNRTNLATFGHEAFMSGALPGAH